MARVFDRSGDGPKARLVSLRPGAILRERTGSYTLEASLLMPLLMTVTFLLLFYALLRSQQALVQYKAAVAAERAAYNWGHADSVYGTGAYDPERYDGLYWRLADDSLLQGLLGLGGGEAAATLSFPGAAEPGESLTLRKLYPAAEALGAYWAGSIGYANKGLKREVEIEAADPGELEPLAKLRGAATASASISSPVTEPAEWIRTFDLARYYKARASGDKQGEQDYLGKAGSILNRRGE